MRIMQRRRTKAAIFVLTRKHKFYCLVSRQRFRTIHQMQRSQSPIDTVHTKVFCVGILELITALKGFILSYFSAREVAMIRNNALC